MINSLKYPLAARSTSQKQQQYSMQGRMVDLRDKEELHITNQGSTFS